MKEIIYPIQGPKSSVHAIIHGRKTTLCGRTPPNTFGVERDEKGEYLHFGNYEVYYMTEMPGFWVYGHNKGIHVGDFFFCPRCYAKMKQIFNISDSQ